MLLQLTKPDEAYRRVELDARIEGTRSDGLADICLEAAIQSLTRACSAHARGAVTQRNAALTRANSILIGLERSVDENMAVGSAMIEFYAAGSALIRSCWSDFDAPALLQLRDDMIEIHVALYRTGPETEGAMLR